jgi:acetyl-CoA carboxylase biotin carboxyl carrier protein
MNLKELRELIELVSEKGFAEFEVERQGFRLRISRFHDRDSSAAPIAAAAAGAPVSIDSGEGAKTAPVAINQQPAASATPAEPKVQLHIIKSPIVGTFYRAASPTAASFVEIGDRVEPETVVCIIEAMKLMNEIQAEVAGVVAEIYVQNGEAVEYGQPIFGIKN